MCKQLEVKCYFMLDAGPPDGYPIALGVARSMLLEWRSSPIHRHAHVWPWCNAELDRYIGTGTSPYHMIISKMAAMERVLYAFNSLGSVSNLPTVSRRQSAASC